MNGVKVSTRELLSAHLRADPRKTAVLVVLIVVMGVVYGRWFMSGDSPESAHAAPAAQAQAEPMASSTKTPASMPGAARTVVSRPLARNLQSDPFALKLERFPPGREEPKAPVAVIPASAAEDPIELAARALVLQSTLCGPSPLACINGVFLRPGQRVSGFVLEKVEPSRVVLGREGVKVELYLK